mgnify:CR=1 FL=1
MGVQRCWDPNSLCVCYSSDRSRSSSFLAFLQAEQRWPEASPSRCAAPGLLQDHTAHHDNPEILVNRLVRGQAPASPLLHCRRSPPSPPAAADANTCRSSPHAGAMGNDTHSLPQGAIEAISARLAVLPDLRLPAQLRNSGAGEQRRADYLHTLLLHDPGQLKGAAGAAGQWNSWAVFRRAGSLGLHTAAVPRSAGRRRPSPSIAAVAFTAGVFLERHGDSLTSSERTQFQPLRGDYEVSGLWGGRGVQRAVAGGVGCVLLPPCPALLPPCCAVRLPRSRTVSPLVETYVKCIPAPYSNGVPFPSQVDFYLRQLEEADDEERRGQVAKNRRLAHMQRWVGARGGVSGCSWRTCSGGWAHGVGVGVHSVWVGRGSAGTVAQPEKPAWGVTALLPHPCAAAAPPPPPPLPPPPPPGWSATAPTFPKRRCATASQACGSTSLGSFSSRCCQMVGGAVLRREGGWAAAAYAPQPVIRCCPYRARLCSSCSGL